MGLFNRKYLSVAGDIKKGNPNPKNYKILEHYEYNNNIVVKINYPDCSNYEVIKFY